MTDDFYSGASDGGSISADWLWSHLRDAVWSDNGVSTCTASGELITLLDCRSAAEFGECHIRRAVHLSLPSIMLRRLAGGKVTINSVLKSNNADVLSKRPWSDPQTPKHTFVLCGGGGEMVAILRKSLVQDGCPVVCLQGNLRSPLARVWERRQPRAFLSKWPTSGRHFGGVCSTVRQRRAHSCA